MSSDSIPKAGITQRLSLLSYKLLCFLLSITDIRLVAIFGRCLGYIVWMSSRSRRRIVARNMRIVVEPTLRGDKLHALVRRNIVRTTMNLACSLKTGLISDKGMHKSFKIVGGEVFEEAGTEGRTAIACVPHAGNWELFARIRPQFTRIEHYSCMYRKLSNPLLEDYVYRTRTKYGCSMHSKEDGLKTVLKLARSGGLLGVLSDQYTQEGIYLPYFGKVTGVTPLPSLLYKRCKGKASLFAVYTRNVALGKWEAIMHNKIELPDGCDDSEEITMRVNLALEQCQKESIIDGFWMHHRWKTGSIFAPKNAFYHKQISEHMRLPFRTLVCVPEAFEEAVLLLPALRILKPCRPDMQISIVCPEEQKDYWKKQQDIVTHVVTTDGKQPLQSQLEDEEIYKEGPFDILFMFSENKAVIKSILTQGPISVEGFADNKLARKFRFRSKKMTANYGKAHRAMDYTEKMTDIHQLPPVADCFAADKGNPEASGCYIAPFSTLGTADSWAEENWKELAKRLGKVTLLALPQDEAKVKELAAKIGCDTCICPPADVCEHLGANCTLYAVDGLLPALAAQAGSNCVVLMASRPAERYHPILGTGHRCLYNHVPCHRENCDQTPPCTTGVTVDDMLGK